MTTNCFFPISEDIDLRYAEERMGLRFPSELRSFYLRYGYGYLGYQEGRINKILHPLSVASFRRHGVTYRHVRDMQNYDACTDDRLVFFQVTDDVYFSIELTTKYRQKIYFMDQVIADSLEEFIKTYPEDEYFIRSFTGNPKQYMDQPYF